MQEQACLCTQEESGGWARCTRQGQDHGTHLWGQHFDQLIQEAELGHLAVELLSAVVHAHLQHLHRHGTPREQESHWLQACLKPDEHLLEPGLLFTWDYEDTGVWEKG